MNIEFLWPYFQDQYGEAERPEQGGGDKARESTPDAKNGHHDQEWKKRHWLRSWIMTELLKKYILFSNNRLIHFKKRLKMCASPPEYIYVCI